MVSVLRKLPQELLDMIISDAAKIPSGALVKLGPSANDTEQVRFCSPELPPWLTNILRVLKEI